MPDSNALKRYDSATLSAGSFTPPSDGFNVLVQALAGSIRSIQPLLHEPRFAQRRV